MSKYIAYTDGDVRIPRYTEKEALPIWLSTTEKWLKPLQKDFCARLQTVWKCSQLSVPFVQYLMALIYWFTRIANMQSIRFQGIGNQRKTTIWFTSTMSALKISVPCRLGGWRDTMETNTTKWLIPCVPIPSERLLKPITCLKTDSRSGKTSYHLNLIINRLFNISKSE